MQVKILKYDDLGNGLLRINGKVCFVKKALPGEVVKELFKGFHYKYS